MGALTTETRAHGDVRPDLAADRAFFADLRRREFARLDRQGLAYLDYTGSGLFAERQTRRHLDLINDTVLGNPHSEHAPSRAATDVIERARTRVLDYLAAADDWVCCFTANASGALRLVAESFPFGPGSPFVLSADNHNSVNGIAPRASRAGATVAVIPLDEHLGLDGPVDHLVPVGAGGRGLLAIPAQSNFSGARHEATWLEEARAMGYDVLLDAAAYVPTARLDPEHLRADFVAISFYKIFGYPTGLGALLARRSAVERLRRPSFAGGTVDFVSIRHGVHRSLAPPAAFEEGTPDFIGASALPLGFDVMEEVGMARLGRWTGALTRRLLAGLRALRHRRGDPLVVVYGPPGEEGRGGTVAFNVLDPSGEPVPYDRVVERCSEDGVAVRGGCFCNPGASEAAFRFPEPALAACLDRFRSGPFSPARFRACLGGGPVGAVRASVGMASSEEDVDRLLAVLAGFAG